MKYPADQTIRFRPHRARVLCQQWYGVEWGQWGIIIIITWVGQWSMVSELQLVRTDCVLARTAEVRTAYLLRTAYCVLCTAYCVLSIPG